LCGAIEDAVSPKTISVYCNINGAETGIEVIQQQVDLISLSEMENKTYPHMYPHPYFGRWIGSKRRHFFAVFRVA
jgi:hypothetical protein